MPGHLPVRLVMSDATKRNIRKIHKRKMEEDRKNIFVLTPRPCVRFFNQEWHARYFGGDTCEIDFDPPHDPLDVKMLLVADNYHLWTDAS